ncbi:hypothetical protein D3C71_1738980 [compost metagenome]
MQCIVLWVAQALGLKRSTGHRRASWRLAAVEIFLGQHPERFFIGAGRNGVGAAEQHASFPGAGQGAVAPAIQGCQQVVIVQRRTLEKFIVGQADGLLFG